ncbi:hypothetical protein Clacol_002619 [Clathrus columnatus]|uniref:J domain-containing protein n=1 Tax=Clathrus columnatus TaxID=1419009 RepID=A0AAV5A4K8_9AGAM|nr:hypothetical protein Clacol_002619 [Clathrus columnatus]
MPTAVSSPLVRSLLIYAGWFILPNSVTNIVFICFIRLRIKINPSYRPPVRGTPQAAILYRYCYASVMIAYLLITTIHTFASMPLNFYEILNVDPSADDHTLKVAFRQFARKNHPDRVGPAGEPLFIAVRDAYESLNDPVKRFAYDRFGSDAMTWRDCATPREYIKHGLLASSGYYIGTIGLLMLWSIFGIGNTGAYLYMSISIAIARVVPILFPSPTQTSSELLEMAKPLIDKLASLAMTTDQEVLRMLSMEFRSMHGSSAVPPFSPDSFALSPFTPSEEIVQALTNEMENLIIDKQLQTKPALRSQWEGVMERLRQQKQTRSASPIDGRTAPSVTSRGSPFPLDTLTKEEDEEADMLNRRAIPLSTG